MSYIFSFIWEMLLYIVILLPIYILIRIIIVKTKKIETTKKREIVYALFAAFLIAFLSQTIVPHYNFFVIDGKPELNWYKLEQKYNLIPFKTIYEYIFTNNTNYSDWGMQALINVVGNLVIVIPFGFLVPVIFKKVNKLWKIAIIGIIFIMSIECIQYFFIGRSADVDDLIVNVLGIMIGYSLLKKARRYDILVDI